MGRPYCSYRGLPTYGRGITCLATLLLLLLLLLLPQAVPAQVAPYTLNGKANANGGSLYPYRISFTLNGDNIKGTSVTRQPDGAEMKAGIRGRINRKAHTLYFTEYTDTRNPAKDSVACLFTVALTYSPQGRKHNVHGIFSGRDDYGKPCGTGTMTFDEPVNAGMLFKDPVPKQPPPAPAPIPIPKDTMPADANKITEGADKHLDWTSARCHLAIWDGGVEDGDVVTLQLNGKDILTACRLTAAKKELWLELTEKVNTLTIIAGDEGAAPPNTADLELTDGDKRYRMTAYNRKGRRASVIITRRQP